MALIQSFNVNRYVVIFIKVKNVYKTTFSGITVTYYIGKMKDKDFVIYNNSSILENIMITVPVLFLLNHITFQTFSKIHGVSCCHTYTIV